MNEHTRTTAETHYVCRLKDRHNSKNRMGFWFTGERAWISDHAKLLMWFPIRDKVAI